MYGKDIRPPGASANSFATRTRPTGHAGSDRRPGCATRSLERRKKRYVRGELLAERAAVAYLKAHATGITAGRAFDEMDVAQAELRRAKRRLEQAECRLAKAAGLGVTSLRTAPDVRPAAEDRRPMFSPKTLASYLAISERKVRQMIADREIVSYRVAGQRRIKPEDVDAYLDHRREGRA
jgi:excisionase family DNA binding protein